MTTPDKQQLTLERRVILLAALIQFINVTDFMMVMPLGPDFADELGIPIERIGIIGASYTFAAAFMGVVSAFFLDRFQRRAAILVSLAGLIAATALGAVVWDEASMLTARIIAGAFGGPLTALGIALVADIVPTERRGQAMGKVMGGFALATIAGVPLGLQLALWFSWHAPFVSTAAFGALVWLMAFRFLPAYASFNNAHTAKQLLANVQDVLQQNAAIKSFGLMALLMLSGFMIIPNISAYLQFNLGFPRQHLGWLYLAGGVLSFFTMRLAGRGVDRWSGLGVVWLFTTLFAFTLYSGFIDNFAMLPVVAIFVLFMVAMTGRGVAIQTLSSRVPPPHLRGAFLSLQSAVTHLASSLGAYYSSLVLVQQDGVLQNIAQLAWTALAFALIVPWLYRSIDRRLNMAALA